MNPFAPLVLAAELAAIDLHAGPATTRGREVPVDRIAEPPFRPLYPRYVKPSVVAVADLPRVKPMTPARLRAEAACHRVRVSRQACAAREARVTARHESARIGGA